MKLILVVILLILLACGIVGCLKKNTYPFLATVEKVDLERYAGRWYEIARYPHRFEKGCSSVTADYSLKDDGTLSVVNSCRIKSEGGRLKKAEGVAKVADQVTNAKLRVSFFRPFYGDYWIVKLDKDYKYAIVGEPSRKYVWILSRTPTIEDDLLEDLVEDIRSFGYDPDRLIMTEQWMEE